MTIPFIVTDKFKSNAFSTAASGSCPFLADILQFEGRCVGHVDGHVVLLAQRFYLAAEWRGLDDPVDRLAAAAGKQQTQGRGQPHDLIIITTCNGRKALARVRRGDRSQMGLAVPAMPQREGA